MYHSGIFTYDSSLTSLSDIKQVHQHWTIISLCFHPTFIHVLHLIKGELTESCV